MGCFRSSRRSGTGAGQRIAQKKHFSKDLGDGIRHLAHVVELEKYGLDAGSISGDKEIFIEIPKFPSYAYITQHITHLDSP